MEKPSFLHLLPVGRVANAASSSLQSILPVARIGNGSGSQTTFPVGKVTTPTKEDENPILVKEDVSSVEKTVGEDKESVENDDEKTKSREKRLEQKRERRRQRYRELKRKREEEKEKTESGENGSEEEEKAEEDEAEKKKKKYECLCCGTKMLRKSLYKHLRNTHNWVAQDVNVLKTVMKMNSFGDAEEKLCLFCEEKSYSWVELGEHLKSAHHIGASPQFVRPSISFNDLPRAKVVKQKSPSPEKNTSAPRLPPKRAKLIERPFYHFFADGIIPTVPIEEAILPLLFYPVNLDEDLSM